MDYACKAPSLSQERCCNLDRAILTVLYKYPELLDACNGLCRAIVQRSRTGSLNLYLQHLPSATPAGAGPVAPPRAIHCRQTINYSTTRFYPFQPYTVILSSLPFQRHTSSRRSGQSPCLDQTRPWSPAIDRRLALAPAPAPVPNPRHGRLGRGESALALGAQGV
jgi:hypothetical protein